jgi:phospholipid-translocating P-type ATPase (flippase)
MVERAATEQPFIETGAIDEQTRQFAYEGLRTIVLAFKELDLNDYANWYETSYKPSVENLTDRQRLIDEAAELIEKDFTLLGITGIEDSLQNDVPETISLLLQAGIKFWVVTGDKKETAINIAVSCQLVTEQHLLKVIAKEESEIGQAIDTFDRELSDLVIQLHGCQSLEEDKVHKKNICNQKKTVHLAKEIRIGAVLDGHTLTWALNHDFEHFMKLITRCDSVIICRATPLQKEQVVKATKKYLPRSQTLAIGDGGNDVSMLRAADVGIGLPGEEGRQAAMAADFQIGQFNRLARLVLVRGRYFYAGMAFFLFYFFYRSFALIVPRLWANGFAAFSGINFYQALFDGGFNLLFASIPILVVTAGERDMAPKLLLRYPELYRDVANHRYFNRKKFLYWLLQGIYHGTLVWAVPVLLFSNYQTSLGTDGGEWVVSAVSMFYLVVVVNLQVAHRIYYWTTVHHAVIWGSIVLCLGLTIVYAIPSLNSEYSGVAVYFLSTAEFWLGLVLVVALALLPSHTFWYIVRNYKPAPMDIVQEIQLLEHRQQKREHKRRNKAPPTLEVQVNTYHVDENNPEPSHTQRSIKDTTDNRNQEQS